MCIRHRANRLSSKVRATTVATTSPSLRRRTRIVTRVSYPGSGEYETAKTAKTVIVTAVERAVGVHKGTCYS